MAKQALGVSSDGITCFACSRLHTAWSKSFQKQAAFRLANEGLQVMVSFRHLENAVNQRAHPAPRKCISGWRQQYAALTSYVLHNSQVDFLKWPVCAVVVARPLLSQLMINLLNFAHYRMRASTSRFCVCPMLVFCLTSSLAIITTPRQESRQ